MNTLRITHREQQIWALMADGMTKKEIAADIDRSYHTVNQLVRNLYEKLEIRKETELVREWFLHHTAVTRDEFVKVIRQKSTPLVIAFLMITAFQVIVDSPAVRVMRPSMARAARQTRPSGRRKQDYHV